MKYVAFVEPSVRSVCVPPDLFSQSAELFVRYQVEVSLNVILVKLQIPILW